MNTEESEFKLDLQDGGGSIHSIYLFDNEDPKELVEKILIVHQVIADVFHCYYVTDLYCEDIRTERARIIDLNKAMTAILNQILLRHNSGQTSASLIVVPDWMLEDLAGIETYLNLIDLVQMIFEHYLESIDTYGTRIDEVSQVHDTKNFFLDIFRRSFNHFSNSKSIKP